MRFRTPVLRTALFLALAAGPAAAQTPRTPPELPAGVAPFEVTAINTGAWYGRFRVVNCAWLDMGDGILLIDTTGWPDDAANLRAQVKETTKGKPIKWIVVSHLHSDSNDGIKTFLPADVTIFVNAQVAKGVASSLTRGLPKGAKSPTFVGVDKMVTISTATRTVEIHAPDGPAHTDSDLFVYDSTSAVAFVGDLVIPGACPWLTDPTADPRPWLGAITELQKINPGLIVPSRNDATSLVQNELTVTAEYLQRAMNLVIEFKKKKYEDARVAGELRTRRIGDYCSTEFDTKNIVALYERADDSGRIQQKPRAAPRTTAPKKPGK